MTRPTCCCHASAARSRWAARSHRTAQAIPEALAPPPRPARRPTPEVDAWLLEEACRWHSAR
eukprot:8184337-Alexandrium_andersonii.AAC.1